MDIDRIRYFITFAELGSLVRASEILNVSQPALSKALKKLEDEVGFKLIEPDGRGLRLTASGKMFKSEAQNIIAELISLPEKILKKSNKHPFRIGSFEVFTTYFISTVVKDLNPDVLEVHELSPGELEDQILNDKIDVGITYIPVPRAGVEFIEVTKIEMGVFGNQKINGKIKDFKDLPFVIPLPPETGTPTKVMGLDGWPDHKFHRNIKFKVNMMESAMELCRQGMAVAYLPKFVVELHNESVKNENKLNEIPSPIPKKDRLQGVYLVKRQNIPETNFIKSIARSLRSLK